MGGVFQKDSSLFPPICFLEVSARECSRLGQPFFQLEPKRIFFKEIACLLALLFPRESYTGLKPV
jgi:hypothetical protein